MIINLEDRAVAALEVMEEKYNNRSVNTSGFYGLDEAVHNFINSQLTVIAGRPAMGKTSFAVNMAINLARCGRKVLYISCEMNNEIFMQRIISAETEVPLSNILQGTLSHREWEKIASFVGDSLLQLKENLSIISSFTDKFDKLSEIISDFAKNNPDALIIIDYFQLLNRQGQVQDRYVELADIASSIKRLAVENNIHIILLSQISRKVEERIDKRPKVSDLSECDALAQHADNILFVHRDEYWDNENPDVKNMASIIVGKAKNSVPTEINLLFFGKCVKFKNKMTPTIEV